MIINNDRVKYIADLARLEISESETEELKVEMNNILEWMTKLNEVDTDQVEPLIHMSSAVNILREDKVRDILSHERGLVNAPQKESNYFTVPKVID